MSFLENQINSFKETLTSSSSKVASKRTAATTSKNAPTNSPSTKSASPPMPSSQTLISSKQDLKRKRPETSNIIYSQPADTGTGENIMTQVTYAIEYLKTKDTPQTLSDLLNYLSLQYRDKDYKAAIDTILKTHKKIEYEAKPDGGEGTFRFKPMHSIRSGELLLGYLQSQPTAQGLLVRDLRDGWLGAEDTINKLEDEGKLLVTRNKKDNHAKMVWPNDPTLAVSIDDEFQTIWHKIKLPEPAALADELEKAQLLPANKSRGIKLKPKVIEKKVKKPRKGGRTTNLHMQGVLRDYSHVKK